MIDQRSVTDHTWCETTQPPKSPCRRAGAIRGIGEKFAANPVTGTSSLNKIAPPAVITDATHPPLTIYFDNNSTADLWMAFTWGTQPVSIPRKRYRDAASGNSHKEGSRKAEHPCGYKLRMTGRAVGRSYRRGGHGIANLFSRPPSSGRRSPPFSTRAGSGRTPGWAQLRRPDLRLPSNAPEGSRPMGDSLECGYPRST